MKTARGMERAAQVIERGKQTTRARSTASSEPRAVLGELRVLHRADRARCKRHQVGAAQRAFRAYWALLDVRWPLRPTRYRPLAARSTSARRPFDTAGRTLDSARAVRQVPRAVRSIVVDSARGPLDATHAGDAVRGPLDAGLAWL